MQKTFKANAKNAFVWSVIDILGGKLLFAALQILIARILTPADYGVFAVLSVLVTLSTNLAEGGMGDALIQQKETNRVDYSTVFYYRIGTSLVTYLVLWLLAPFIASFYAIEHLASYIRIIGTVFIINAFSGVQSALLSKNLAFKSLALRGFVVNISSGLAGLYMAYEGFGIRSLIYMTILQSILNVALLWPLVGWVPGWEFSTESLKKLRKYGSKMAVSNVLNTSFSELNKIVAAKAFGVFEVGLYNQAVNFRDLISNRINQIFTRVLFPLLSKIQDDKEELEKRTVQAIQGQSVVTYPLLLGMIYFAEPLVSHVYTAAWKDMVPFLQLLAVIHFISPINTNAKNLMRVLGRSDSYLQTEVLRKVLYVANIVVSLKYGMLFLVKGSIAVAYVSLFINCYFAKKASGISIRAQVLPAVRVLGICIAAMVPLFLVDAFLPEPVHIFDHALRVGLFLACCAIAISLFTDTTRKLWASFRK